VAGIKTPFINGTSLFFTLESFPKLFATLNTRSRKQFFEMIKERQKVGGEGITDDEYVGMVQAGLLHENPAISFGEAKTLMGQFIAENDYDAFENKISYAFAHSGLTNLKALEESLAMGNDIKEIQMEEMKQAIAERKKALSPEQGEDMGKQKKKTR
jgi:hypothetical protein